ncbi:COQ9 family protein [Halovulum dunhuangense]|uniref:COQ9 family protein n=1 Tax=Halovulum dunhuangense TaxID=1505036 RepID=A0A849L0A7_9RHOB|nr:COQ9 family protein [Halovulum dunhuangense]NNU79693.1 COQ9 family protein [Halovulum dunhuangense]
MTETQETGIDPVEDTKARVLAAALPNVVFDGWTDRAIADAVRDCGVDPGLARLAFPRGGIDLALAFHWANDAALARRMAEADLGALRYSERVARAIEMRLELVAPHREAVRRAAALFALPIHAADGARAIWHTADTIWTALGDTSEDVNWYTKRATLSGVYSATVLYWLGDDSPDMEATRAFIDRRIGDVMQIEKVKARFREHPIGKAVMAGPGRILSHVRAPGQGADDLPGRWRR